MVAIPDTPEEIAIQLERSKFIESKLIDQVADDSSSDKLYVDQLIRFETYPVVGGFFKKK